MRRESARSERTHFRIVSKLDFAEAPPIFTSCAATSKYSESRAQKQAASKYPVFQIFLYFCYIE